VAAGEHLPMSQPEIARRGHAVEVRLYAEVPEAGFLPSSGTLRRFELPAGSQGVRIESGIEAGDVVGIDYDPMLAKLIVHAGTRPEAVAALRGALSKVRIAGVGNNVAFLRRLVASGEFARGQIDIGFIERTPDIINGTQLAPTARVLAAAALWVLANEQRSAPELGAGTVWDGSDGWRLNGCLTRSFEFGTGFGYIESATVALIYAKDGMRLSVAADPAPATRASLRQEGEDRYHLQYGAEGVRVQIEEEVDHLRVVIGQHEYRLRWRNPREPLVEGYLADTSLAAPMPGRIIAHLSPAGTTVTKGAPLLIMEAMKMEHTICAPANGTVRGYLAAVGQQVKEGAELIDFEAQR